jgi:hypothetical protein
VGERRRRRPATGQAVPTGAAAFYLQLQRFVVKLLDDHKVPYLISHSASGVAVLQLALRAGRGISCLNESSIGGGLLACAANIGLPRCQQWNFICSPGGPAEANM